MVDTSSAAVDGADGLSPEEAFALLGNDTRVAILRALWEAHEPFSGDDAVSFSELRERVGVRDSGQFNYHLEKLAGRFVERTEEGYELRRRGLKFAYSVVAGTAGGNRTLPPTEVDVACRYCGAPTTVSYEDEHLYHRCTECDGLHAGFGDFPDGTLAVHPFAPAGLSDRTPEEIFAAERTQAKHERAMMVDGVCPECSGPVEPDLRVCEDHDDSEGVCDTCCSLDRIQALYACSICKHAWMLGPKLSVATHPAVVGFYYERGVEFDVADFEESARVDGWERELVAEDPAEVRVTVPFEGDELRLTLNEELDVIDVRERA